MMSIKGVGNRFATSFAIEAARVNVPAVEKSRVTAEVLLFFGILETFGAEFGFRTAQEIQRYFYFDSRLVTNWSFEDALDAQVFQKILPKLNGSRRRLEPILSALAVLCHRPRTWDAIEGSLVNAPNLLKEAKAAGALDDDALNPLLTPEGFVDPKLPLSFDKVRRMLQRVSSEGFASFAEA